MNLLIAGGTGFVGHHLIKKLISSHTITVLGRDKHKIQREFKHAQALTWDELNTVSANSFDAVINLCGRNIGEGRWTNKYKQDILNSRTHTTKQLVDWCLKAKNKPHLYNTSAIGIYGLQPLSESLPPRLTETSPINPQYSDFLSEVGQRWEAATKHASDAGMPVTIMRFGVVLKRNEAVLKKLQLSFFVGLGGKVGTGTQAFTWVHIDDVVNAIDYLLSHPEITGPVNICAPECVSQAVFAKTLAKAMHRPCFFTTPAWVLKLAFGQMADELLLNGQHVYPARLLDAGFQFTHPTLQRALAHDFS